MLVQLHAQYLRGDVLMKNLKSIILFQLLLLAVALPVRAAEIIPAKPVKIVKQYGQGTLLDAAGTKILLLAGTPYQMGMQYGTLLRTDVRELNQLILKLINEAEVNGTKGYKTGTLKQAWRRTRKFIDQRFIEEMQGVADGAGLDFNDVALANTLPELFHCSGFALFGEATADGKILHGRILDYMTGIGLQKFALIVVAQPLDKYAFVNIGYAGMIGSVTGMNEKQIAIGEMGGDGVGQWDGMPMAFLLRKALEEADTLEKAVNIFKNTPRTCEYYYVISDAKIPDARALACTPDTFEIIVPNKASRKLPYPVKDAVLVSRGTRYEHLVAKVKQKFGDITINDALDFMDRPVAMQSCLHRVLFSPQDAEFWVANAGIDVTEPNFAACYQPYYQYNFKELLKMIPTATDQNIPLMPKKQLRFKK